MKNNLFPLVLALFFCASTLFGDEKYQGMAVNIPNWIKAKNIVEICHFRHVYIAPTEKFQKGRHTTSGVITKVIKGNLKVGTRIDRVNYDDTFRHKADFDRIVEGQIDVVFLDQDDVELNKEGIIETTGWIASFDRVSSSKNDQECRRALKIELAKEKVPQK